MVIFVLIETYLQIQAAEQLNPDIEEAQGNADAILKSPGNGTKAPGAAEMSTEL